jgi:hypothetical protein
MEAIFVYVLLPAPVVTLPQVAQVQVNSFFYFRVWLIFLATHNIFGA